MSRLHTSTNGKFYRSGQVKRVGSSLAFDEGRPEEVDPVEVICQWCIANLTPEQLRQLSMGISETAQGPEASPPVDGGMDDGEEYPSGYRGGRQGPQSGPGGAGPWPTGKKASAGALDSGLR